MRLLPTLRRTVVSLSIVMLLAFATLLANQRLLWRRTARLHAEVAALQLHPGAFSDLQRMQQEWGRFAHYDGVCTREHCIYEIVLSDPLSRLDLWPRWYSEKHPWLQSLYSRTNQTLYRLGFRLTTVDATLRVHNDRMWGANFSLLTDEGAPPTDWHEGLIVVFKCGPRLFPDGGHRDWYSAAALKQGYRLTENGSCSGCHILFIEFNPNTTPGDIERLTALNTACLGSWRGCATLADLIPNAWREYKTLPQQPNPAVDADARDCSPPLDRQAMEADHVVLVEAQATDKGTDPAYPESLLYHLRALERLKNADALTPGSTYPVGVDEGDVPGKPVAPRFLPGRRYIFLYPQQYPRLEETFLPTGMELTPCSVFPATPEALEAVKRGVAQDASIGEPYEILQR